MFNSVASVQVKMGKLLIFVVVAIDLLKLVIDL